MPSPTVALAGAGQIGSAIARGLANESYNVTVLTRGTAPPKGLETIPFKTVNYDDDSTLVAALQGIEVVISTLSGAGFVERQLQLAKAAREAGSIQLFITSDWGLDMSGDVPQGISQHWDSQAKSSLPPQLEELGIPYLRIANGVFGKTTYSDFLAFDFDAKTVDVVGDPSVHFTVTAEEDVAGFVAAALRKPIEELRNRTLNVAGFRTSFDDLIQTYEKVKGVKLHINPIDTQEAYRLSAQSYDRMSVSLMVRAAQADGFADKKPDNEWVGFQPKVTSAEQLLNN